MYTVEQVARHLNLNVGTVRRYIREKKLRASKFGKAWRISAEQVQAFIKSNSN